MTGDELEDIVADLVGRRENSPFLTRLFALPAATWGSVALLAANLPRVTARVPGVTDLGDGPDALRCCWIDYPKSGHGSGYCVILFFVEHPLWSRAALFNKTAIEE